MFGFNSLKTRIEKERIITDARIASYYSDLSKDISEWQKNLKKNYDEVWLQSDNARMEKDAEWKKETDEKNEKFQNAHLDHARQLEAYLQNLIEINAAIAKILSRMEAVK